MAVFKLVFHNYPPNIHDFIIKLVYWTIIFITRLRFSSGSSKVNISFQQFNHRVHDVELLRFVGNFARSTEVAREFFDTFRWLSVWCQHTNWLQNSLTQFKTQHGTTRHGSREHDKTRHNTIQHRILHRTLFLKWCLLHECLLLYMLYILVV